MTKRNVKATPPPQRQTWIDAKKSLHAKGNPTRAKHSARFFKTGPGEYAEGDIFIGVTVPETRAIARLFKGLSLPELSKGLRSKIHEERLLALVVLVDQFEKADAKTRDAIYKFYFEHLAHVNNWDLVDSSAAQIVGVHLESARDRAVLYRLAKSKDLWERRVGILSTFHFIRCGDFKDCLAISEMLMVDKHDLIHKASGWMLREAGKRDRAVLEGFLEKHCEKMPRTMLRYAIEHFSLAERKAYLAGKPLKKRGR